MARNTKSKTERTSRAGKSEPAKEFFEDNKEEWGGAEDYNWKPVSPAENRGAKKSGRSRK